MPNYLCLQRSLPKSSDGHPSSGPAGDMQEWFAKFNAWREQYADNLPDLGGKLGDGQLVTHEDQLQTDGPFVEAGELVGGYMIIKADSLAQAAEIARACPGVVRPGSGVEVVEIKTGGG